MSAMADILFILMIFFMMCSTLTAPSALNLTLPGKSNTAKKLSEQRLTDISITEDGQYRFNGRALAIEEVKRRLEAEAKGKSKEVNVTVSPDAKAPVENVVAILDMTTKLGINAILSAE